MAQSRYRTRAGAATEEESLNPISCKVCRQRKCKCDRRLPFCSQCAAGPSKCVYPESGKRGLPSGYLNQLEQRLAETESALYGALMRLRSQEQSTPVPTSTRADIAPKQKAARMEEWSQLPLREWPDMEHWLTAMSDRFTTEPPRDAVPESSGDGYTSLVIPNYEKTRSIGVEPHPERGANAWRFRDRIMASPYSVHQPHTRMGSSIYLGHSARGESQMLSPSAGSSQQGMTGVDELGSSAANANVFAARVDTGRSSKAEELSHNNPSLYF